jgi:hypothetical protein
METSGILRGTKRPVLATLTAHHLNNPSRFGANQLDRQPYTDEPSLSVLKKVQGFSLF